MPGCPASSTCHGRPLARTASSVRSSTGLPASSAFSLEPAPPAATKRSPRPEASTITTGEFAFVVMGGVWVRNARASCLRNNAGMTSPLSNDALAALRKSYERAELSEEHSHADPLQQFDRWLTEAIAARCPSPTP
jgi:hypothetical protein